MREGAGRRGGGEEDGLWKRFPFLRIHAARELRARGRSEPYLRRRPWLLVNWPMGCLSDVCVCSSSGGGAQLLEVDFLRWDFLVGPRSSSISAICHRPDPANSRIIPHRQAPGGPTRWLRTGGCCVDSRWRRGLRPLPTSPSFRCSNHLSSRRSFVPLLFCKLCCILFRN